MTYIDRLALEIAAETGDVDPVYRDMPLYRIYAVLMLAKGEGTTAEDVHNAWSAWAMDTDPAHRSLIPFCDLADHVQRLDEPYVAAIHRVADRHAVPV